MANEVYRSRVTVPDVTCPPPGWDTRDTTRDRYKGRASDSHVNTRVIKRTDLRQQSQQRGGQKQQQQRPPRFSNLDREFNSPDNKTRRRSWGDVWRPEADSGVSGGDQVTHGHMMEGRDESSGDESGEWKQVKGRRWGPKDDNKKESRQSPTHIGAGARKKTPEPQQQHQQQQHHKRRSPDQRKSPDHNQRKSPDLNQRRSPDYNQRRTPDLPKENSRRKSKSPQFNNNKPVGSSNRRYNRRGSSSSNEGSEDNVNTATEVVTTPPNHEELMKRIPQMMMVSDLPDEKIARCKKFTRRLSETEIQLKQDEEKFKLQEDVLRFLRSSWNKISSELADSDNHWPPKICYFQV